MRVVSLVPSATETLTAWGSPPIACTRFCERDDLTTVGGTKNPSIEGISSLKPDLVVMEREENRREDYEALLDRSIPVHVLSIRSLTDVTVQLQGLADRLELDVEVPQLVPRLSVEAPLRLTVPIWRRPWMVLGAPTYGASLLEALGAAVVPNGQGPYPTLSQATFESLSIDAILAPSEPYHFQEKHRSELDHFATTFFCDGRDLFWWGIRTPHALARIRELLVHVRDMLGKERPSS
jgi:ABC-type Fe3+-hydroxamate transport system substrate-binding protein